MGNRSFRSRRHGGAWLVVAVVALVTMSCGGGESGGPVDETSPQTTASVGGTDAAVATTAPTDGQQATVSSMLQGDADFGSCSVRATGDFTTEWSANGGAAAVYTDYWFDEDELREQHDFFAVEDTPPFDELIAAGKQVFSLLLLNCGSGTIPSISFFVSDVTTRADFPFAPGTYEIAVSGAFGASDAGPGVVSAIVTLDDEALIGSTGGTLTITEWDATHIAGTFSFGIEEKLGDAERAGQIDGEFDFKCFAEACP